MISVRRVVFIITAILSAAVLSACAEWEAYTPSAADLTRIVEEIPPGPTRDMIEATAVARYLTAEAVRQEAIAAQNTADALRREHESRVALMTAEAQAIERARASAAESTRQALDAQARQLEINATATAQAAQSYAQATAQAAAAQATATAQVIQATATAQAASVQATATAQAVAARATAQAESRIATATAQSQHATATTQAARATATREAYYWQQTVAADDATSTAMAIIQEEDAMELQRQRLTHPLRTFGPWFLLVLAVASTCFLGYRAFVIWELRNRAIPRDERGDAPIYAAGAGRAITLVDVDRQFYGNATIVDGEIVQSHPTAPDRYQERTTGRDQVVDLGTRGLPNKSKSHARSRRRLAKSLMQSRSNPPPAAPQIRVVEPRRVLPWIEEVEGQLVAGEGR